ncbi:MAG: hypothetical protein KatS3mg066_4718 [Fischerella sp.]|nr:MAG: hypothetical protein KatS3mg066_4718 [Fischerella sp.]
MMQSSDLNTRILPISPSHVKKHNRTSTPKLLNNLSAVRDTTSNQIHYQEMSAKDVSQDDQNCTSAAPLTDVSTETNSNEPNASVSEKSDAEKKPVDTQAIANNAQEYGFWPVLKNPNFLALWGGQVFCQLADKVYLVLMIALINTHFQTGAQTISAWVSALMITFTIPAVLFGSLAGAFVDRWSKKMVLVGTNIWRGILVLIIPSLLWLTQDWQPIAMLPVGFVIILGITFLVSTLTQFFAPAEQAAIPLVVKEKDLLSANSLYTTTMMASVIIGFAIGEPLLAAADRLWLLLGGSDGLGKEIVVGGSYAIAGLILLLLITNEKPHPPTKESPHVFADLRDGSALFGEKSPPPQRSDSINYLIFCICSVNSSCCPHGRNNS